MSLHGHVELGEAKNNIKFHTPKPLVADNMPLLIIKLKLDFIHSYVCGGFINRLNISVSLTLLLKIKDLIWC